MNKAHVETLCRSIGGVLDDNLGGTANPEALGQIRRLVGDLRSEIGHLSYLSQKVGEIEDYTEILYSARKHHTYDRDSTSGANLTAIWIRGALSTIESHIRSLPEKPDA